MRWLTNMGFTGACPDAPCRLWNETTVARLDLWAPRDSGHAPTGHCVSSKPMDRRRVVFPSRSSERPVQPHEARPGL